MDFASITLFLILVYLRPQEWIGFVATLKPVTVVMGLAIISMVMRYRGFTWRDFFKTPHDYWMTAYLLWVVLAAPNKIEVFKTVYPFFFFYVVTVQALSTMKRSQTFLYWWTFMIWIVAALAIAGEYGFDPMHSYDVTHNTFKDRLVLNTSIFNNPNALGHSVYPGVLLMYFTLVWRRPIFMKIAAIPIILLMLYCIFLTVSRGTFLCCFVTIIVALMFGRPRVVQLLILTAALTVGVGALKVLPRMGGMELSSAQSDTGIQGRIAASKFGFQTMMTQFTGLGLGHFNISFYRVHRYYKAAHSSYVGIGAELGLPGLFIFLGIMYCCFRTVVLAVTRDTREERVRRMLFVLVFSHCLSSWMIDFEFRATLFLFCAAIAAFHRLLLEPLADEETANTLTMPLMSPHLAATVRGMETVAITPATVAISQSTLFPQTVPSLSIEVEDKQEEKPLLGLSWNSFRWQDLVLVCLITFGVVRFWQWIIGHM